jgi:hypothetical protein
MVPVRDRPAGRVVLVVEDGLGRDAVPRRREHAREALIDQHLVMTGELATLGDAAVGISQHLTVAPIPGACQERNHSLNQGASCGSGLGGGAPIAARVRDKTAAQPIQLYSASRPWTGRRRVWWGFIVLMARYRQRYSIASPPMAARTLRRVSSVS